MMRVRDTLLNAQLYWIVPSCLLIYVLLHVLFQFSGLCVSTAMGPARPFNEWSYKVCYAAAWCFSVSVLQRIIKIIELLIRGKYFLASSSESQEGEKSVSNRKDLRREGPPVLDQALLRVDSRSRSSQLSHATPQPVCQPIVVASAGCDFRREPEIQQRRSMGSSDVDEPLVASGYCREKLSAAPSAQNYRHSSRRSDHEHKSQGYGSPSQASPTGRNAGMVPARTAVDRRPGVTDKVTSKSEHRRVFLDGNFFSLGQEDPNGMRGAGKAKGELQNDLEPAGSGPQSTVSAHTKKIIKSELCIHIAALTVNVIAAVSNLLITSSTTVRSHDRRIDSPSICVDSFGIASPVEIWSEWMVSVPLLGYIAVAIEAKTKLVWSDFLLIFSLWFSIFSGFLLVITRESNMSREGSLVIVLFSTLLLVVCMAYKFLCVPDTAAQEHAATGGALPKLSSGRGRSRRNLVPTLSISRMTKWFRNQGMLSKQSSSTNHARDLSQLTMTRQLFLLLLLFLPLFPLIYFLGVSGLLDRDEVFAGFTIASMLTKLLFINNLTESQINSISTIYSLLLAERRANDTRSDFLRYIFHEVRSPLNTMSMGVDLLIHDEDVQSTLPQVSQEVLLMLNNATSVMSDVFNDVLLIHKLEKGELQLSVAPFSWCAMFAAVCRSVQSEASAKQVTLSLKVAAGSPSLLAPRPTMSSHRLGHSWSTLPNCKSFRRHHSLGKKDAHLSQAKKEEDGKVDDDDDEVLLLGDRVRIESTLRSFLSNAIKVSSQGSNIAVSIVGVMRSDKNVSLRHFSHIEEDEEEEDEDVAVKAPTASGSSAEASMVTSVNQDPNNRDAVTSKKQFRDKLAPSASFNSQRKKGTMRKGNSGKRQRIQGKLTVSTTPSVVRSMVGRSSQHLSSSILPKRVSASPSLLSVAGRLESVLGGSAVHKRYCHIKVVVHDKGEGFTEDHVASMFKPFTQIRTITNDDFNGEEKRGSGLGLALAKEIIQVHGGLLLCDSKVGQGSSFGFIIPFEVATSGPIGQLASGFSDAAAGAGLSADGAEVLDSHQPRITHDAHSLKVFQQAIAAAAAAIARSTSTVAPDQHCHSKLPSSSASPRSTSSVVVPITPGSLTPHPEAQTFTRDLLSPIRQSSDRSPASTFTPMLTTSFPPRGPRGPLAAKQGTALARKIRMSAEGKYASFLLPGSSSSTSALAAYEPVMAAVAPMAMDQQLSKSKSKHGLRQAQLPLLLDTQHEDEEMNKDDRRQNYHKSLQHHNYPFKASRNGSKISIGTDALKALAEVSEECSTPSLRANDDFKSTDDLLTISHSHSNLIESGMISVTRQFAHDHRSGDSEDEKRNDQESSISNEMSFGLLLGSRRSSDRITGDLRTQSCTPIEVDAATRDTFSKAASPRAAVSDGWIGLSSGSRDNIHGAVMAAMKSDSVVRSAEVVDHSITTENSPVPRELRPVRGPLKFLIVDDTPSNSKMLQLLLKRYKIDSDIACNGQEAVDMVEANSDYYDLIFMDFMMPVMMGPEATCIIRNRLGYPRLIVGITGNALDVDVKTFINAGADGIITKPIRPTQLQALLTFTETDGFESLVESTLDVVKMGQEQYCVVKRPRSD